MVNAEDKKNTKGVELLDEMLKTVSGGNDDEDMITFFIGEIENYMALTMNAIEAIKNVGVNCAMDLWLIVTDMGLRKKC